MPQRYSEKIKIRHAVEAFYNWIGKTLFFLLPCGKICKKKIGMFRKCRLVYKSRAVRQAFEGSPFFVWIIFYFLPACSFNKSRISVSNTSSLLGAGGAAGAGTSSFLRFSLASNLINKNIEKAAVTLNYGNFLQATSAGFNCSFKSVKFTPPTSNPMGGMMTSATMEDTILPKAPPK